jgi:hypothetical protein
MENLTFFPLKYGEFGKIFPIKSIVEVVAPFFWVTKWQNFAKIKTLIWTIYKYN